MRSIVRRIAVDVQGRWFSAQGCRTARGSTGRPCRGHAVTPCKIRHMSTAPGGLRPDMQPKSEKTGCTSFNNTLQSSSQRRAATGSSTISPVPDPGASPAYVAGPGRRVAPPRGWGREARVYPPSAGLPPVPTVFGPPDLRSLPSADSPFREPSRSANPPVPRTLPFCEPLRSSPLRVPPGPSAPPRLRACTRERSCERHAVPGLAGAAAGQDGHGHRTGPCQQPRGRCALRARGPAARLRSMTNRTRWWLVTR